MGIILKSFVGNSFNLRTAKPFMKPFIRKNFYTILISVLLLPLFYINVKDSQDWGDDFAQYFIQARNVLEHRPQTDNGLVFDVQTGEYALQAYPMGFPLLLAGAWKCFGDSVLVSSIVVSIFFFALGLISYFYFRKYFSEIISVLLTLVFIYNPCTIEAKREILSEIPFTFFLLLGVLLFQSERKNIARQILTGIIWGFAISVRGIGAILFLATGFYLVQTFVKYFQKKNSRDEFLSSLRRSSTIILIASVFYFLLNTVLFSIPSGGILTFYANAIRGENFGAWFALNLNYYYGVFLNCFSNMGGSYEWISTATKFILLALLLAGIIISWSKKIEFADWVCIANLIVLFVYPYLGGGYRFLLPIMPFLLKYIFTSFNALMNLSKVKSTTPALVFLLIILLQYTPGIIDQVKSMSVSEEGPQEQPAREAFRFIAQQLPADAVIVFLKPRALSFYSGKQTTYAARNIKSDELKNSFSRMNAHYFLICNENDEVNDVLLKKYLLQHKDETHLIYQNQYFDLYDDLKK